MSRITDDRDQTMVEWSAWQRIVRNWHLHTDNINADNELVNAIRNWGEELAALRRTQGPDVLLRARQINCKPEAA